MKKEQLINSSPIYMVNSEDLEEMVRGLIKDLKEEEKDKEDSVLLTINETAKRLNVNRSTLWCWEKQGYLKPIRIGKKVRYRLSTINSILKER